MTDLQELHAPIDSDFRLILLSAMRYAMGRNTCMPVVVSDYIKRHVQLINKQTAVYFRTDFRYDISNESDRNSQCGGIEYGR